MRKTLKVQLAESRRELEDLRARALRGVEAHVSRTRQLETTIVANAMELRELRDQVAVQHAQNAEMSHNAEQAIVRYNRSVEALKKARDEGVALIADLWVAKDRIRTLSVSLTNRIWDTLCVARVKLSLWFWAIPRTLGERIKSWWAVRRLSRGRVEAMQEAGYIPRKLIKIAREYWEHDKGRLESESLVWDEKGQHRFIRPSLWAKLKILMGRG